MARIVGLGIDLVDMARIEKLCAKRDEFARHICTEREWDYCSRFSDPAPSLAARFAAKEAVSKALGTGIGEHCSFNEVEVISLESGAPTLELSGSAAETARQQGITSWSLSLTHSRLSAAAVVIALAD